MLSEKPWRAEAVIQFCAAQFVCLCLGGLAAACCKSWASGFKRRTRFRKYAARHVELSRRDMDSNSIFFAAAPV
jgi:hypothetical protein